MSRLQHTLEQCILSNFLLPDHNTLPRFLNNTEKVRILDVLSEHVMNGTTVDAGGIMRVPMSDFTCPKLLEREYEVFFRNTPLCMGLSSELPKPNSYWSDIVSGVPILMVRDDDGTVLRGSCSY